MNHEPWPQLDDELRVGLEDLRASARASPRDEVLLARVGERLRRVEALGAVAGGGFAFKMGTGVALVGLVVGAVTVGVAMVAREDASSPLAEERAEASAQKGTVAYRVTMSPRAEEQRVDESVDAPAGSVRTASRPPAAPHEAPQRHDDTLALEAAMLRRAHALLAGAPNEAYALTEEHAARFPHGQLGEERERLAVSALAALGHTQQAKTRAERFLREQPTSAHREAVERVLRGLAAPPANPQGARLESPNSEAAGGRDLPRLRR